MDTVEEILQALFIGISVATVLLQTCRHEKTIEIFNECLFLLKQHASKLGKDNLITHYSLIYGRLSEAYKRVGDYTNAFECLQNYHEEIGNIHQSFGENERSKENYKKAADIQLMSRFTRERQCSGGTGGASEGDYVLKRKKQLEKDLEETIETGDKEREGTILWLLGAIAHSLSAIHKAIDYNKKALAIWEKTGNRKRQLTGYSIVGTLYSSADDFVQARQYFENALAIAREFGDRTWEGVVCGNLATVYTRLNDFAMARKFLQQALNVSIDNGDVKEECKYYHNLALCCCSLREYDEAGQYFYKSLSLSKQLGDKNTEAATYSGLSQLYFSMDEYARAEETVRKALEIRFKISDILGEGIDRCRLGNVCLVLGKYEQAKTCYERAIEIHKSSGNKKEEGNAYSGLGSLYSSLGEYDKSIRCFERSVALGIETNDRRAVGMMYANISHIYQLVGNCVKAKQYREKGCAIPIKAEPACEALYQQYLRLGDLEQNAGEYVDARENFLKAIEIAKNIRNQRAEATALHRIASLEGCLKEWSYAKDYSEKALQIMKKIGAIEGECRALKTLGEAYYSLGDIVKAKECFEMSLAISKRILNHREEGATYDSLGSFHGLLGEHVKAIEFWNKALKIAKETGFKASVMTIYGKLGSSYFFQKDFNKAQECYEETLRIAGEIGDLTGQSTALGYLAVLYVSQEKFAEAMLSLNKCISILESVRKSVGESERYQIAFDNREFGAYRLMAWLLCLLDKIQMALFASELGRARSLAESIVTQYSLKDFYGLDQMVLFDFYSVVQKASCTCLSFLFFDEHTLIWALGADDLALRNVSKKTVQTVLQDPDVLIQSWIDTKASQGFRMSLGVPDERYEDRSLNVLYSYYTKNLAACRLLEEDKDNEEGQEQLLLKVLHRLFIAPVVDRLTRFSEVIVVPDGSLFKVPFAALMNEDGNFLSEKFRIRYTPSLTTLKLIQDSPADYHSDTGVLIVGDPDVGTVVHRGRQITFSRLPFANQEAEMIGRLLGVHPVTGKEATKQTVLQKIHSVGLIHIAAHGDADRGNIALAPSSPEKNDFLLTMSDISKVQLRAKLVVLSCCHSGKGEIKAEGVVGIARAFLGAGARSVLASLWAVDDEATMHFMKQFYEHLVRGKSASESLHETMKCMRENPGCCEVRKWAPFMLIGDDVSFNFRN